MVALQLKSEDSVVVGIFQSKVVDQQTDVAVSLQSSCWHGYKTNRHTGILVQVCATRNKVVNMTQC